MRLLMLLLGLVALGLTACSSSGGIREGAPAHFADVKGRVEAFSGKPVRWGGMILGVHNVDNATLIEVLQRKLDEDGIPLAKSPSLGRFLVRAPGFLDPAIYSKGRYITVVGKLAGGEKRKFDQTTYDYPVVSSYEQQLWDPVKLQSRFTDKVEVKLTPVRLSN